MLDGQRIPAIRDALNRLAAELEAPGPDGGALRALLEHALGQVEALHAGALTFMKALGHRAGNGDRRLDPIQPVSCGWVMGSRSIRCPAPS